ncbi:dGTPase [Bradyrhizobium sp. R2.2-H]|jgi:dGTPase|uniref:dGTP triphosphohydrolase n=1 Tax=unclassified Bradyrhizobium TaxID=2631580 RepID=UPI0010456FB1|nr:MULTISPECIES: dNTP triphosphohydrolase [unclassified Bradyrhizobium]TCU74912.1 dGTPase [Bradyrhizobium sp. Y-H1]TCU77680.1 dGTPase [Bradyrhizobium sp. R2.2-H]
MGNAQRRLEWAKLLNGKRRKPPTAPSRQKGAENRISLERDYDRLLFSTPVRRLADKTQVFPLERNDSVRTRLTHSHEVANLARSIGTTLVYNHGAELGLTGIPDAARAIPSLLAAVGLAHDLGNPPFGHQGEDAMQSWIARHSDEDSESFNIFSGADLTPAQRRDFEKFEGNAQALRLLTRLQIINDGFGLNMSYAALAALMKYPVSSDKIDKKIGARKKFNFFQSEATIVEEVWQHTGLEEGVRHPLTLIMEACDDIAYSVLDLEDAAKKGLISFHDLIASLNHDAKDDPQILEICQESRTRESEYREAQLSGAELSDISMQMLRVQAIGLMVNAVTDAFVANHDTIMVGEFNGELLAGSRSDALWKAFKSFAKKHVYSHRSVIEVELEGHRTIHALMDAFWQAIRDRGSEDFTKTNGAAPYDAYVYSRISENYRRAAQMSKMPMRYRELQLMTDMISGMTDSFAVELCRDLVALRG